MMESDFKKNAFTGKTVGFIGAGNMAEALIKGLIGSGTVGAGQILASDKTPTRLLHMAEVYEVTIFNNNSEVVKNSDIVILAVKPGDMDGILRECALDLAHTELLISIAAGVTTGKILDAVSEGGRGVLPPLVRAMPNTPALIGEGIVGIVPAANAGAVEMELSEKLFSTVGGVVKLSDEGLLNAVTGLSGSGPAYVFLFMEALMDAGVKAGIDPEKSRELSLRTTLGAAALALKSGTELSALREMVSSPGGTTIEGLKVLEKGGFYDILVDAVLAATKRSEELSTQ